MVGFRAVYPPLDLIVSCDGFTSDERNDVVDEELLDCVELSRALPTILTASVCSHLAYRNGAASCAVEFAPASGCAGLSVRAPYRSGIMVGLVLLYLRVKMDCEELSWALPTIPLASVSSLLADCRGRHGMGVKC